jgi:hypothetical protein
MGATSTNLTVTIVTKTEDDETDLLVEAEIVAEDNDGSTTYYVSETYYLRLFKSTNISSIASGCNVGSISKVSSGLTASVPYEGEDDEYITFTGSDKASLDKVFESNFSATQIGKVFDENGAVTTASLTAPTKGYKTVLANKAIFGVYKVTYTTKYDKWSFNSPTAGPMIIFFIGTGT